MTPHDRNTAIVNLVQVQKLTLSEIGACFGISREMVRRVAAHAGLRSRVRQAARKRRAERPQRTGVIERQRIERLPTYEAVDAAGGSLGDVATALGLARGTAGIFCRRHYPELHAKFVERAKVELSKLAKTMIHSRWEKRQLVA